MNKYLGYICLTIGLISCSSAKQNVINDDDKILFIKAVSTFEMIDELSLDWNLKRLDTLIENDKIKYDILSNEKEEILELSLDKFETLIATHPQSQFYHKSLYNLAHICALLDYEDKEINYLKMLLESDANDKTPSGRKGIMANPYANFKNNASNRLTNIYINKGNYQLALEYKKINEKYPYQHFCGNAFAEDKLYNAKQYATIYEGLGQHKKAIQYLLPHIFNNYLANNEKVIDLALELLKKHYNSNQIKADFETAINKAYSKTERNQNDEWTRYFIDFMDTEIEIPALHLDFEMDLKQIQDQLKKTIKSSPFYLQLHDKTSKP